MPLEPAEGCLLLVTNESNAANRLEMIVDRIQRCETIADRREFVRIARKRVSLTRLPRNHLDVRLLERPVWHEFDGGKILLVLGEIGFFRTHPQLIPPVELMFAPAWLGWIYQHVLAPYDVAIMGSLTVTTTSPPGTFTLSADGTKPPRTRSLRMTLAPITDEFHLVMRSVGSPDTNAPGRELGST